MVTAVRIGSIYEAVGWSKKFIKLHNQHSNFRLNSYFSFNRNCFDWLPNQHVFSRGLQPISADIKIYKSRFLTIRRRLGEEYHIDQVSLGASRKMVTSNKDEATKTQITANAKDNTETNAEEIADELNGLEKDFQESVKISPNDLIQSDDKKDEPDITPLASTVICTLREDSTKSNKIPTAVVVDKNDNVSKSLRRIASLIDEAKNILILSGAGVSVAAGIPDFRTPGTGLYDNLQKYSLPYAEAVFDIQYYQLNPKPFVQLAAELWPDHHKPTITHSFIALLAEKQRLLRNYTQVRTIIDCSGRWIRACSTILIFLSSFRPLTLTLPRIVYR